MGDPDRVLWVRRLGDLLLTGVLLLGDDDSSRFLDRAVEVTHHRRSPDVRKDLHLPHQEVITGELLHNGVAKGGEGGRGHGGGG